MAGMPRTYISQREAAAEYEPPARGAALGASFGSQYKDHIVLEATVAPKDNKRVVTIVHCAPPDWQVLLGSLDRSNGNGEHLYRRQVVPAPSQAAIEADHQSTYEPIDETKSVKITKVPRRKKTDGTYEDGYPKKQVKSKGQDDLTPAKFRRLVTTSETTTTESLDAAHVNDIPDPADPAGDQNRITHQKLNDDQYAKTIGTEVIAEHATPLVGGRTSEWGVLTSSERVVNEGSAVPHAEGVAQASVNPFGNGKAEESKLLYPNDIDGVIGYLLDEDTDPQTGIITDVTKMLVVNSEIEAVKTLWRTQEQPWLVEAKAQDQNHTILIASRIDLSSLPDDEVYWSSENIRLPDRLDAISVIFNKQLGGGNGSSLDEGGNGFSGSASAQASASISPSIGFRLSAGFSGRTKVKITRRYQYGPPGSALVEPFNIVPVRGSVTLIGSSRTTTGRVTKTITDTRRGTSISNTERVGSDARIVQIGPFLNSGVVPAATNLDAAQTPQYYGSNQGAFAYASARAEGQVIINLDLSSPGSIASGSLVARYQVPSRWRLGVWVVETVEVYAP